MSSSYKIFTAQVQDALIIVANRQKKALLSAFLLCLGFVSNGQSYLISPTGDGGFETGTTFAANGWTTVNPANTALWQIGTTATGYSGARGVFVGPSATSYTYTNTTSRTCHFYRDITVPAGATGITLSWLLKGTGETGWDRLLVYTAPTSVTPAANSPASSSTTLTGATLIYTQGSYYSSYSTQTVSLPGSLAGTTFRLIFTWQNDGSLGTTPPAAVDNISLTYTPATTCSGTPSGITVNSTQTYGCTTYTPTLSLTGISGVSGLTFQWQSSPTGSSWTSVSGATNATYAPTVSSSIYYRCVVTCTSSGGAFNTSGVNHVMSATAGIPYTESFESITAANTLPSCMASTNMASYTYTYLASTGSYNQAARTGTRFGSFRWGCNDWFFTPAFALTAGSTYVFSFWYVTDGYGGWGPLQAKYGTSQTAAGMTTMIGSAVTSPGNTTYAQYTGTFTATSSGNFYIGINCVSNSTPWYLSIDDIGLTQLPGCTGTPSGVTVTASQTYGCTTYSSTLGLAGLSTSGYTFQWQSSADSTTWSNISGATGSTYTASVSTNTYYRCVVTCSAGGSPFNTPGLKLVFSATAAIPYTESFEGITANNTLPPCMASTNINNYTYTYTAATGSYNQFARTGTKYGSFRYGCNDWFFTPGFALTAGNTYVFSFWYITDGYGGWGPVQAKYGTSQTAAAMTTMIGSAVATPTNTTYAQYTGTFTATASGTFYIGINCVGNGVPWYLTIDDLNLTQLPACSGTPTAGTVSSTISTGCGTVTPTLSLSGATSGVSGLTYQWQSSPDGASWASISGATTMTYAPTISGTTYYRHTLSCSSASATTASTMVSINPVPAAITGGSSVCLAGTVSLSSATSGGTWSSSSGSVTISSTTGVATGASTGASTISYNLPTGCRATQVVNVNTVVPTVSASVSPGAVCYGGNATFTATPTSSLPGYDFAAIGFAPVSFTPSGTINSGTTTTGGTSDDGYYGVTLPFDFSFYGTTYTSGTTIYICNNGYLTFGSGMTSTYINTIPNSGFPATIAMFGRDMYLPNAGTITYGTTGTTPNRKFVISWNGVADFSTGPNETGMIVLNETSSTIELHVTTAQATTHTFGIQSASGGQYLAVPGQNNSSTAVSNSAWQFSIPQATYSWSPSTYLSTTTGLTVTATAVTTMPAQVYTVTRSYNGCSTNAAVTLSVNPLPANIDGTAEVCEGLTTALTNVTSGGTWQSSAAAQGTIDATSGVFSGIAAGTSLVSYTLSSTGCRSTKIVTVNPLPGAITGTASVCSGSATSLTSTPGSGSWISSSPAVAAITSSGVVTGGTAGVAMITYTLPTGCIRAREVTVNPLPSITLTPSTATVCAGDSASIEVSSPALEFSLLNENFNTGLGVWTVTTTIDPADGVSPWKLVSSSAMSISGDGTAMMEAAPSASSASGLTKTYLVSPSFSTVGFGSANLTFNEHLYSSVTSDVNVKVQYSTDGGSSWTTLVDQLPVSGFDTLVGSGDWDAAYPEVSVPLPSAALNVSSVKLRWFYETNWGGWWEVDNIAVKAALPAATFTWAGVSGATGLSCANCATPKIAPSSVGANVYNVTANSTCSSNTNVTINVNPLPGSIGGASATLCVGSSINLTNPDAGGIWSSSNASIASVDASTGVVSGIGTGSAVISYTLPSSCVRAVTVSVDPAPAAIMGTLEVCDGLTTSLSHSVSGGIWSSSAAVAYIDASSGVAMGNGAGNAFITYVLPSGCKTTAEVTVNQLPSAISGTPVVCTEATTMLSSSPSGGTWSSNNATIASFVSASGEMTGVSAGATIVTYMLPTGCIRTAAATVNASPDNIAGIQTVCEGLTTSLSNVTPGGNWSNDGTLNATVDANGIVSGVNFGTSSISYMLSNGCYKSAIVTVNQTPAAITGIPVVCEESATLLASSPAGGSWSSDNTSTASFVTSVGEMSGISHGTATVTYALSTGCLASAVVTVNALPDNITGTMVVCEGLTTTLNNATVGGSWSTANSAIANISATGIVDAVAAGNVDIIYTLGTGCYRVAPVTVNELPGAITGTREVCEGLTTLLSCSPAGGTWDGNTPEATINSSTGLVSGLQAGASYVSYILPTGCLRTAPVTVHALPGDISGTLAVCQGLTTALGNSLAGGQWTSSNSSIADVNVVGVVTGTTAGNALVTYTIPATGCFKSAPIVVNPLPADISGTLQVCEGLTTVLSNSTPDGSWSAIPSTIAAVNALGVVNGINAGNEAITYMLSTGCLKTVNVVVNPLPADISGTLQVCEGLTTNLSNTTGGGSWSGGNALVATIDGSGIVSATNQGTIMVTYTLNLTGCLKTADIVVNPLPADITGANQVCDGSSIALANATPGGNWNSLLPNASVDAAGVVTGNGAGSTTIVYILPTGCLKTADITINALPDPITGSLEVCEGATTNLFSLTPGGSWSTSALVNASIDGAGVVTGIASGNAPVTYSLATGCIRTADVAVHALPSDIDGIAEVCEGLTTPLENNTPGGVWSSDAAAIAGVDALGVVSGLANGNANIIYTLGTGCAKSVNVIVHPLPDVITGTAEACEGSTTALANATPSGSWLTSSAAIAGIDMTTGIVTGINAGSADISYVLPTGCMRTVAFAVKSLPADIAGTFEVCQGLTTVLSNADATGSWSTGDIVTATVDPLGVVTGSSAGTVDIIYTLPNGCAKSANVLVHPLPASIVGVQDVCESSNTALNSTTAGGIWTSSSATTADVDILSGVVSGVSSGTATITYALMTGCLRKAEVTVNALPAPITGATQVCQGQTTALSSSLVGLWTSSSSDASVDAAGIVTGVAFGSADIAYTLATGCSRTAHVIVNPLPAVYNVTGGGAYCAGTGGVLVGGSSSDMDIAYQLYNGSTAVSGGPIVGSGSAISFGMQAAAGTYSILATDILTGCVNGMTGSANVTILPLNIPSVTVSSTAGTTVCAGSAVTYNAAAVNGGTLPAYSWEVNGVAMTGASSTFSYTPANGDVVKVTLTSNASCAIPAIAADMLSMTVNTNQTPVATIALPAGVLSVCKGSNITLTATSLYGGSAPVYDWYVNSTLTATGSAFTYAPNNGDLITSKLTSNYTCVTTPTVMSNTLTMAADPVYIPVISIGVSPGTSVPVGTMVTFTAMIGATAGPAPSFQWYKNGMVIGGATGATYTTSALTNSDSISCKVIGTSPCGYESFNSVIMRVKQTGVGQLSAGTDNISLVPNPNKGDFTVKGHLLSANDEEVNVEVTNMLGQTVYKAKTTARGGNINERVHLNSSLANGMYMLNIRSGEETSVLHFVLEQ